MKESFLLYHGYYEPIKALSFEDKGRLFEAIFEFSLYKKEPVNDSPIFMAFQFFKNQLVQDEKKYNGVVVSKSKAGHLGGAPNGNKNALKNKQNNHTLEKQAKQAVTVTVTDTDTVTVTVTVTDFEIWGKLIVEDRDQYWHQMRGRKIQQPEMDSFISVAIRNNWTLDTQHKFRLALNGFEINKFKPSEQPNKYKLQ